jgi:rhodanese-related sulfurtransferase
MKNILLTDSISADEVKRQWDENKVLLVDVREPAEYTAEHIPRARLEPLSRFNPRQLAGVGKPVVLVCASGQRAQQAATRLAQAGGPEVRVLVNGIASWKSAGYPLERGPGVPISLMRQVQITAGSLVLLGTLLGAFVSPAWLFLSGFVGAGLVFAGVSNTCGLALLLARMPWNQGY